MTIIYEYIVYSLKLCTSILTAKLFLTTGRIAEFHQASLTIDKTTYIISKRSLRTKELNCDVCVYIRNNKRNKANKQLSQNFDENQAKQERNLKLPVTKVHCTLQLFYVVHLQCDPFHSWFFCNLCRF